MAGRVILFERGNSFIVRDHKSMQLNRKWENKFTPSVIKQILLMKGESDVMGRVAIAFLIWKETAAAVRDYPRIPSARLLNWKVSLLSGLIEI